MTTRQTCFFLSIIAIASLFPILHVWIVNNDDIHLANAALGGGFKEVLQGTWHLTASQGRLHLGKMLSMYLPVVFDNFVYYKVISYISLVLCVLLFSLLCKSVFYSTTSGLLAGLFTLTWLQNSLGPSPVTSHTGLWTFELCYFFLSTLLFIKSQQNNASKIYIYASAALYLKVLLSYELFILYLPLYVLLSLKKEKNLKKSLRDCLPFFCTIAIFLLIYLGFQLFKTTNYPGATIGDLSQFKRIAQVIWQFSISSLPTYFFFNSHYQDLFRWFNDGAGIHFFLNGIQASWIIKAMLAGWLFVHLAQRQSNQSFPKGQALILYLISGVYFFFSPPFLPSLTTHYQNLVAGGTLDNSSTFFCFFAFIFLAVLATGMIANIKRKQLRDIILGGATILIACSSLMVDCSNYYIAKIQTFASSRWRIIDQFLASPEFHKIPAGATIYSPTLFTPFISLHFVGREPYNTKDGKIFVNYWTKYFSCKGGKRIILKDNDVGLPASFYYMKYEQDINTKNQYLLLSHILPSSQSKPMAKEFYSDKIIVFDQSPRQSFILGGRIKTSGQAATTPKKVKIIAEITGKQKAARQAGSYANNIFLLPIKVAATPTTTDLTKITITAPQPAIISDSIFFIATGITPLSIGHLPPLRKLTGWYPDKWIKKEATIELHTDKSQTFHLKGFVPATALKKFPAESIKISLLLNNKIIGQIIRKQEGLFSTAVNIPAHTDSVLTIKSNASFMSGGDNKHQPRQLSFLVTSLSMQ